MGDWPVILAVQPYEPKRLVAASSGLLVDNPTSEYGRPMDWRSFAVGQVCSYFEHRRADDVPRD